MAVFLFYFINSLRQLKEKFNSQLITFFLFIYSEISAKSQRDFLRQSLPIRKN